MKPNELRSLATMITSGVNNMCNVKTLEEVNEEFLKIKDLLIEIYKHNVTRVQENNNT